MPKCDTVEVEKQIEVISGFHQHDLVPSLQYPPRFLSLEGDGEVLRASNGADVQPAKEAANPGEGSPGKHIKGN